MVQTRRQPAKFLSDFASANLKWAFWELNVFCHLDIAAIMPEVPVEGL
jgi:hypothetical protein